MKKILGRIALRRDNSGEYVRIFWREQTDGGKPRQVSFYWGLLPTGKLEILLGLISSPNRNARKRICRMVGLSNLTAEKLLDSDFFKNDILERFKAGQQKENAPFQPGQPQLEQASLIAGKMADFQAKTLAHLNEELNIFNSFRQIGIYFNSLCDNLPGKRMTIDFWQQYAPLFVGEGGKQIQLETLKWAASIARNNKRFTLSNRPTKDMEKQLSFLVK